MLPRNEEKGAYDDLGNRYHLMQLAYYHSGLK